MRELDLFGRQIKLQGSVNSLLFYSSEFGTDFLQDFVADAQKSTICIGSALALKATWAMNKTAEPDVPCFEQWIETFEDFTLEGSFEKDSWVREVEKAITAELFRTRKTKQPEVK